MARMWWPALVLLPVLLLGLAGPARADEADEAYYRRASACTAVLKREVVALRDRFLRGDAAVRPEIQRLTEQSFTFVGIAYKRGLRNPQADRLLDEAEAAQQRQPATTLRQLFNDCQAEGAKLFSGSNAIERALVRNRAKARVDQLLTPPARTG
jgi:hypothetical protein